MSSFSLGEMGNDEDYTTITRAQLRLLSSPSSATMTNYYKDASGDDFMEDITTPISNSRFDIIRSARWHKLAFTFDGTVETPGLLVEEHEDGTE